MTRRGDTVDRRVARIEPWSEQDLALLEQLNTPETVRCNDWRLDLVAEEPTR